MGYYMAGGSVPPEYGPDLMRAIEDAGRSSRARAQALDPQAFGGGGILPPELGGPPELDHNASPRMNMANPRAARRAMRRITAFAKAAQKIVRFPKAKKHHHAPPFHRRRKKRK